MPSPTKPPCPSCHGARVLYYARAGTDASLPCDECCGAPPAQCECCGLRPIVALAEDGVGVCDACLELSSEEHYERAYTRLLARSVGHPDDSGAQIAPGPIDVGPEGDSVDIEFARLTKASRPAARAS